MKAPFGRIGGKSKIADKLIDLFPPLNSYKIYVEPFVGAGNVFFKKPYLEGQLEVINDLDKDVYKVMKLLKNRNKFLNENFNREIDKNILIQLKMKQMHSTHLKSLKAVSFNKANILLLHGQVKNII
jgi:site-specific DNA-adenine methylase